jgi:hypothetical protein
MTERRVRSGFAAAAALALVKRAGAAIVGGGPQPQPLGQSPLGKVEERAADAAALRLG